MKSLEAVELEGMIARVMESTLEAQAKLIASRVGDLLLSGHSTLRTENLVSISQLCKMWSTNRRHVTRLIKSGALTAIDLTPSGSAKHAYAIEPSEIRRFEELRRTRKPEKAPVQRRRKKPDYEVFV